VRAAGGSDSQAPVDARNPYLGLVSFTEETREYFFGREEEVAELARRVQRKLLTVLFGKSGLGKTSILRAGLLPRLRRHGYCPVYVRIAYGRDSPEPAEQIKAAIRRAASVSGEWTQAGVAAAGESLWEFLHHRDDVLRDADGAPLLPLLIFDQFEELFTLAQSDEFGRARAANFIEELADLVENRAPKALEARLDEDDSGAERFDFARSDYRVLIALREDYLAPLESLRQVMPSLLQNRVRLGPMTSAQALEAVRRPGGHLVSEATAAAIVRFVAGGSGRADSTVEPSLLSLVCRELNDARLAQGREEISLDLLAGSHESILVSFYERSLADQPAGVRRVIEDELLTDSGFRENVAEERLLKRFQAAGAAPEALSTLVNRRLLRIEERLDVRRVELTHDVLCGVVKTSRDQRQEREARETAERVLEEQRERARAARHALRRARAVALGCILLAALALSAALFAYVSAERARRAERLALQNRALAEQARNHAEHLLGYLADDFERQLESFGQLKLIAEFTQRQIDYFHSLPPALRSPATLRYGALALIEHAETLRELGDYDTGIRNLHEAMGLLSQLRRSAHPSAATEIALGRADTARCLIVTVRDPTAGLNACHHAVALLRPIAMHPGASVAARQAYLEALTGVGWAEQNFGVDYQGAERATREAMRIAAVLGAADLRNLQISADYAFAGAWRVNALVNLDRNQEALRVGTAVLAVTNGVLAQRPWYRLTLNAKEITESTLAQAAGDELDPRAGEQFGRAELQSAQAILRLDPKNVDMRNNLGLAITDVCVPLWAQGQLRAALGWCHRALDAWAQVSRSLSGGFVVQVRYVAARTADWQAVAGDLSGALRTAAATERLATARPSEAPPAGGGWFGLSLDAQAVAAEVAEQRGQFTAASHLAQGAIQRLRDAKVHHAGTLARAFLLYAFARIDAHAEFQLGHFAAAAAAARLALAQATIVAPFSSSVLASKRARARISTLLAMALARQGKRQQATQVIGPVVTFEDSLLRRNHGDVWVPYELAGALYAQSLCDPPERARLRARAATLLQELPPTLKTLRDVRRLQHWLASGSARTARTLENAGKVGPAVPAAARRTVSLSRKK
jgi:tetratricopeptide (TPR) repeat protein